jgi:hypothetical protein
MKLVQLLLAATVLAVPALALADRDDPHPPPVPEAVAACKDKVDGDACEFDGPHGHRAGSCRVATTGDLFCRHPSYRRNVSE